jgi:hypothetical protein
MHHSERVNALKSEIPKISQLDSKNYLKLGNMESFLSNVHFIEEEERRRNYFIIQL